MAFEKIKVLGAGSTLLDILARVDDAFLSEHVAGEKGGMNLVNSETQHGLIDKLDQAGMSKAIGGSAFNTVSALTTLGFKTAFIGKLGKDEDGRYYTDSYRNLGGDVSSFKYTATAATGTCLCLVTPDSERTMRTDLGATATINADDISDADFEGITHVHLEGYLLFFIEVVKKILMLAKKHGCTVSFDFASFEVVRLFRSELLELLEKYVDIIFANEDEAKEFCKYEKFSPEAVAENLFHYCSVVVVKLGKEGSFIRENGVNHRIPPVLVNAVDTTGAGDLWQGGFLYGYLNGYGVEAAGRMGSVLGAEIVQVLGAQIPPERWPAIREEFEKIKKQYAVNKD